MSIILAPYGSRRILTESTFPVTGMVRLEPLTHDQRSAFGHTGYKGKQKEIVDAAISGVLCQNFIEKCAPIISFAT